MTYPNRIYTYVFLLLLLVFFPSCNPQPEARKLLLQAEHFADAEQVDSGLCLIDSIFYPEKSFDKEDQQLSVMNIADLGQFKGQRTFKTKLLMETMEMV